VRNSGFDNFNPSASQVEVNLSFKSFAYNFWAVLKTDSFRVVGVVRVQGSKTSDS
jgi:hypothetical protein